MTKKEVFYKKTHAEIEGILENVSRFEKPYCQSVDLDFKVFHELIKKKDFVVRRVINKNS